MKPGSNLHSTHPFSDCLQGGICAQRNAPTLNSCAITARQPLENPGPISLHAVGRSASVRMCSHTHGDGEASLTLSCSAHWIRLPSSSVVCSFSAPLCEIIRHLGHQPALLFQDDSPQALTGIMKARFDCSFWNVHHIGDFFQAQPLQVIQNDDDTMIGG